MLKKVAKRKFKKSGGHFAIVASSYNTKYVDSMLSAARGCLRRAGAATVKVVRVPGAYEIPVVAVHLARAENPPFDAIVCLGVILRGATTHAAHIGEAVTRALTDIQLAYGLPVIHEVLLLENEEQARQRCLDPKRNRGLEAAQTALEMARILATLKDE